MDHLHCSFDQSIFQLVADELAVMKPTEATERSDPKCTFAVLIDTRDVCIGQAIIHRVMDKLTILESVQTVILCSYPQVTIAIFTERHNQLTGETVLDLVVGKHAILELAQTLMPDSHPNAALAIFVHRINNFARETILDRIAMDNLHS